MTTDRDPTLQSLFDIAGEALAAEVFVAQVMTRIDSLRRRVAIGWISVGLVTALCGWLLATRLQDAIHGLTQMLPLTLIDLDMGWAGQVLAPVNSIAGLTALGLLGLRMAYRKIFA